MDEGLKGREVFGVLVLRSHPQVDLHPGWIGLPAREGPLHRITDLVGLRVPGPFHHHEVRRIVFEQEIAVLEHIRLAPSRQVEPSLWIEWIAVSGVPVLIHAGRDPAGLIRSGPRKSVEDKAIAVCPLGELHQDYAGVGPLINFNRNPAGDRIESLAVVIQVIPRWEVAHAADQDRASPGQPELAAIVRMLRGLEDPRAFVTLRRPELSGLRSYGYHGCQGEKNEA